MSMPNDVNAAPGTTILSEAGRSAIVSQGVRRHPRFAFVFSETVAYPPNIHFMKSSYLARQIIARGGEVTWVELGGKRRGKVIDGIRFEDVSTPPRSTLLTAISLGKLVVYCLSRRIKVVYFDDWLFLRNKPWRFLAGVVGVRVAGIKVVLDERDPSVDFKVATGELSAKSKEYARIVRATRLTERLSNLVILTSKAYERLYVSEGFPPKKVFGSFRGIDTSRFNATIDPTPIRARLGLEGKFVIGWFGLMHPFRLIREVIVPMIREVTNDIPNAHVIIGGEGPLFNEFRRLSEDRRLPLTVLGLVSYEDLPGYIAACDVLLCAVSSDSRFTQNSAWLKIPEALAVGKPVIATRTNITHLDYKGMKGVIWVEPTLAGFKEGLKELRSDYAGYLSLAKDQSLHFDEYAVPRSMSKIVDRIEVLAEGRS